MNERTVTATEARTPEFRDAEGVVTEPFLAAVQEAIGAGDRARLRELAGDVHEADLGALIAALATELRPQLIELLGEDFDFTALTEVDESVREEMLDALPAEAVAKGVRDLDSDDAVYLLQDLSPQDQREVLRHVPTPERLPLERSLRYPEESAGRLMQTEFIAVPPEWKVGDVIDHLRETRDLPDSFYEVYVVEPDGRLAGAVRLDRLLRSMRPVRIADILVEDLQIVRAHDDQENAARRFERYNLVSAPVVDEGDRLVGVLTADDVLDVIEEEAEEDLRALAGVRSGGDLSDSVIDTARLRLPWLLLNLISSFLAAGVIAWFEATIAAVVAVAILMPVNAALGGNAGTQALAVAVRALATQELNRSNMMRVILREALVGVVNGIVLAVLAGAAAGFAFGSVTIGLVLSCAMVVTVIFGTTVGIAVPILVDRLKVDPAIASGVFVLTIADVFGFFIFLVFATVAFGIG
ncbi:MAG TPA: magnesium transporter [Xanthobacteraceae bacterium]|nr:magnesium transporter [Xanthobacteraceae bacterium]